MLHFFIFHLYVIFFAIATLSFLYFQDENNLQSRFNYLKKEIDELKRKPFHQIDSDKLSELKDLLNMLLKQAKTNSFQKTIEQVSDLPPVFVTLI